MDGATVAGTLNMDSLEVGQNLFMRNATFKDVNLLSADVGGQLAMDGATVAGTLNMESIEVGQHLFMRNAIFQDVSLAGRQRRRPARHGRRDRRRNAGPWTASRSGRTCSWATPPSKT